MRRVEEVRAENDSPEFAPQARHATTRGAILCFYFAVLSGMLLIAVALRVASLQGLLVPVRISGASMAEALPGDHYLVFCTRCRFPFRCGIQDPPPANLALCPNCGYEENGLNARQLRPGTRVLIDRLAFWTEDPQRWDVVAFYDPLQPQRLAAKRIVGLPGERIQIRGGEVFADDKLLRKSFEQLADVSVLVHDHRYRDHTGLDEGPVWSTSERFSRWSATSEGFAYATSDAPLERRQWIVFHNRHPYRGPQQGQRGPISDNDPFNQGRSRLLHSVSDVWLRCRIQPAADGQLAFLADDGCERFRVDFRSGGPIRLYQLDPERLLEQSRPIAAGPRQYLVEFGIFDRQVVFRLDQSTLFHRQLNQRQQACPPPARPFAVGARGGGSRVSGLQVWRDVYYLPIHDGQAAWKAKEALGPDEVLVLGDNAPVSFDSRHWPHPGLPTERIKGRILRHRR